MFSAVCLVAASFLYYLGYQAAAVTMAVGAILVLIAHFYEGKGAKAAAKGLLVIGTGLGLIVLSIIILVFQIGSKIFL